MIKKCAAVVGLGAIAPTHIAVLRELDDVELAAVCDLDPKRAGVADCVPFYTNVAELLAKAKPDVIHLCLPHWLHYPVAKQAAEAGVNVLCEKPLANDLPEAIKFAELEANHPELQLGLCLQNRYNNSAGALLRIIGDGTDGGVTGIKGIVSWRRNAEYYRESPWRALLARSGGGVMNNQAVHTLDLIGLLGGEIDTVRGNIFNLLDYDIEVEDTAMASIHFKNGAVGLFMATVANSKNDSVDITVTMERGEYRITDGALYRLDGGNRTLICTDEQPEGGKLYYGNGHSRAIGAFYHSLANGTDSYIHAAEGVASMRLIDAIRRSSAAAADERTISYE